MKPIKIPKWMHDKPIHLGVVKDVAAVLLIESRMYGREKNRAASAALRSTAWLLQDLAKTGKTWNEIFEFVPPSAAHGRNDADKA